MRQRILSGWNFIRVLYVVLGLFVVIQSGMQQQWLGVLIGGYFASMGIFAFGCGAGKCCGTNCQIEPKQSKSPDIENVAFEEVK